MKQLLNRFGPLAILLVGCLSISAAPQENAISGKDFDTRQMKAGKQAAQTSEQKAGLAKLRERLPGAKVDFDKWTGSPAWVSSTEVFLTGVGGIGKGVSGITSGISPKDLHLPTKAFLEEHRHLFGHGAEALAAARVERDYVTPHNGLHSAVWQQEVSGIPVFEARLISHTTAKGELVSISSKFLSDPSGIVQSSANLRLQAISQSIGLKRAVRLAAKNVGDTVDEQHMELIEGASGAEQKARFHSDQLPGLLAASLTWLPTGKTELRLCWDVILESRAQRKMFRILVDSETGAVLLRRSLTRDISNVTYQVYTNDSPTPFSPGYSSPSSVQPATVNRAFVTFAALDTNASPAGWINDGVNETLGNNVDAHMDRNGDDVADLPRPQGAPFRVFTNSLNLAQDPTNYSSAAVVQLFYLCNWMHDKLYQLGFNEAAGNFQTTNFGRGGNGGDPLMADAQDGGDINNADMATPPDGLSPRMQMYLWDGPIPRRDGSLDAEIVLHEYTHGLSGRLVGGGDALNELQSGGLGEGWSDFYALSLLSAAGDNVNGNYASGAYAAYRLGGSVDTRNYYFGIRRYPYTTDMTKNPLTFNDIDPVQADNCSSSATYHSENFGSCDTIDNDEVHSQGEVWCVTLWDARSKLINKYGWAVGNNLILQLVTDGMKLTPPNPNFLQARDAILQADLVNTGGTNQAELWAAFAKRGMGYSATSPASVTTEAVLEAFDTPDSLRVNPRSRTIIRGDVGGPFSKPLTTFALTNVSGAVLNWSMINPAPWLEVSPAAGTLPVGGSVTVAVTLSSAAAALGQGTYSADLVFTNLSNGKFQTRPFRLQAGAPDYFTELFDAADNDSAYQMWTFTPDGSASFYSVCRSAAMIFPTDPTGGATLALGDDLNAPVTLSGTNTVALYNRRTNIFYVGSNGYLTMNEGNNENVQTFAKHFSLPRISGLLDDLNPDVTDPLHGGGGLISWKENSDRVAVTYSNVPLYVGDTNDPVRITNSFQIEMFYDGRIRITHLNIGATDGLMGLSAGQGVSADFLESDFSAYPDCFTRLTLALPAGVNENAGALPSQGQVRISPAQATNLLVRLISFDTNKLVLPASVVVTAGQTNAGFNLTAVDNAVLDGTQPATVTASATGFSDTVQTLYIHDNETATLSASLPAATFEGATGVRGTVGVSAAAAIPSQIQLFSSNPAVIQVPATVYLAAGQTSVTFDVTVPGDAVNDGVQVATVTAHVQNWTDGQAAITVADVPTLTFANNAVIAIPSSPNTIGNASPYPSTIAVSGVSGRVTAVTVTLNGFTHTFPEDVDILLVGPTGTNVLLLSDPSTNSISNVTLTISDRAAGYVPQSTPIVPGTYRPTDYFLTTDNDTFNSPAPSAPFGTALDAYIGQNPNGDWKLFARDDALVDAGSLNGGWNLNLQILTPPAPQLLAALVNSNQVALKFPTVTGFNYQLQYKDTATDAVWQATTTVSGDGYLQALTNSIGTNRSRFFRLEIPVQ